MFDGQLEKIRLQKLLFLLAQRQEKPDYDFVPYRFGCYSFSAHADLTTMVKNGLLEEDEKHYGKLVNVDFFKQLKTADQKSVLEIKTNYGRMNTRALMKHTYIHFPLYATKSEAAKDVLSKEDLEKVKKAKPKVNKTILFTIGYEGISLEEYLLRLLKNDVKILVDVRNNPLSMKFGFSKSQLKNYCASLGVGYEHIPEVGIQSEQRQELNSQGDYDKLFALYRNNNLTKTTDSQLYILNLLKKHKRVALTCFEANICQCHRKHLAEAIEKISFFEFELKHI